MEMQEDDYDAGSPVTLGRIEREDEATPGVPLTSTPAANVSQYSTKRLEPLISGMIRNPRKRC